MFILPPKTNMEPENQLIEKEIIFQTFIFGFHVSFREYITKCTTKSGKNQRIWSKKYGSMFQCTIDGSFDFRRITSWYI